MVICIDIDKYNILIVSIDTLGDTLHKMQYSLVSMRYTGQNAILTFLMKYGILIFIYL